MSSRRRRLLIFVVALAMVFGAATAAYAGDDATGEATDGEKTETTEATTEEVAQEAEPEPVVLTEVSSTLPVLGSGLTVSVTIGEDGTVTEVGLDPAGDATLVRESDHGVKFEMGDGETKVSVRAGSHGAVTTVRSNSLENVSGDGAFAADVFGTGTVTIPYTVGQDADGAPTVTVGTIDAPSDVTAEVRDGAQICRAETADAVLVSLQSGDQSAIVWIKVRVRELDDGTVKAAVSTGIWTGDRHRGWGHRGDRGERSDWRDGDRGDRRGGDGDRDVRSEDGRDRQVFSEGRGDGDRSGSGGFGDGRGGSGGRRGG